MFLLSQSAPQMQVRASGGWGSVKVSVLQDESDKEKEKGAAVVYKEGL